MLHFGVCLVHVYSILLFAFMLVANVCVLFNCHVLCSRWCHCSGVLCLVWMMSGVCRRGCRSLGAILVLRCRCRVVVVVVLFILLVFHKWSSCFIFLHFWCFMPGHHATIFKLQFCVIDPSSLVSEHKLMAWNGIALVQVTCSTLHLFLDCFLMNEL